MKVCLFIDSLGSGGAQRQLVGLAVMLQQHNYDVKVCYYHDYPFYKEILDANNVSNELIPNASNCVTRIPIVMRFFKKESPDWVIAYQETPSLIASLIKLLGCKFNLIVSERNTTQRISYRERVRFFLYRWSDVIVPNSYSQEKVIKDYNYSLAGKIKVITNFIDLKRFDYCEHQRHNIPIIIIVARVWPQKNVINLIKAAKELKDGGTLFFIKWYGLTETHSEYVDSCEQLIKEYNLSDVVKLLPRTNDIENKYKECDYLCLPSIYEGTPNVIAEAMATGMPVVCSNVCDNHFYVKNGVNGILFDPYDVSSIANGILKVLDIKGEEYFRYCKESRRLAEKLFAPDVFFEKYESIIQNK